MAKIEFELKDCSGVDVEIGDEIIVTYPEIDITGYQSGETEVYRPEIKARAKIYMPPSKGLTLKVLEIISVMYIDDSLEKDFGYAVPSVGNITEFRRTVWDWHKVV